jgi:hypothetical protein
MKPDHLAGAPPPKANARGQAGVGVKRVGLERTKGTALGERAQAGNSPTIDEVSRRWLERTNTARECLVCHETFRPTQRSHLLCFGCWVWLVGTSARGGIRAIQHLDRQALS